MNVHATASRAYFTANKKGAVTVRKWADDFVLLIANGNIHEWKNEIKNQIEPKRTKAYLLITIIQTL